MHRAGRSRLTRGRDSKHARQEDRKAERVTEREELGDPFHESSNGTWGPIRTPLVTSVSSACQTGGPSGLVTTGCQGGRVDGRRGHHERIRR